MQSCIAKQCRRGWGPCIALQCNLRPLPVLASRRPHGGRPHRGSMHPIGMHGTPVRPVRPAPSLALLRMGGLRTPVRPVKPVRLCEAYQALRGLTGLPPPGLPVFVLHPKLLSDTIINVSCLLNRSDGNFILEIFVPFKTLIKLSGVECLLSSVG